MSRRRVLSVAAVMLLASACGLALVGGPGWASGLLTVASGAIVGRLLFGQR